MVFPFKTCLQPEHDNARSYMIWLLTTVQPLLVPCSLCPSHIQHSKQIVVFWIYHTSSCLLAFVHVSPPAWSALSALSFRQTPIPALGRRQVLPPLCGLLESPLQILSSVSPGTVSILNPHPELELSTFQLLLSTGMNEDFVHSLELQQWWNRHTGSLVEQTFLIWVFSAP